MKIVQHTPSTLTLQLRPWFFWMISAALTLPGLTAIALQPVSTLTCQRTSRVGTCELTQTSLTGSTRQTWKLSDITDVEVVSQPGGGYAVHLQTQQDDLRFPASYTASQIDEQQAADEIQAFLQDSDQSSLMMQAGQQLVIYSLAGMSVLIGLAIASLLGQVITCSFDKGKAKIVLTRNGVLGRKTTERGLYDIVNVVVEESSQKSGRTFYRIAVELQSGERLRLTDHYGPLLDQDEIVDRIRAFLRLKPLGTTSEKAEE